MSNLIMPSAFICVGKYFHIFFQKKMLGLSKAIGDFVSPLPCNGKFECSVYVFRSPWMMQDIQAFDRMDPIIIRH